MNLDTQRKMLIDRLFTHHLYEIRNKSSNNDLSEYIVKHYELYNNNRLFDAHINFILHSFDEHFIRIYLN